MLFRKKPPAKPVKQVLIDALAVMKERGLCEGDLENEAGQCCPLGALSFARTGEFRHSTAYYDGNPDVELVARAIYELRPFSARRDAPTTVYSFNDRYRRSEEQMYAVFERAIELADEIV